MNYPRIESQPRFFVSADWSKDPRKRSVYVADLSDRRIRREARNDWGLGSLMSLARQLSKQGSVLVGIDVALGVPRSYWELVLAEPRYGQPATFIAWLGELGATSGFFDPGKKVKDHQQWRVDRPWFHVPPGKGGPTSHLLTERERPLGPSPPAHSGRVCPTPHRRPTPHRPQPTANHDAREPPPPGSDRLTTSSPRHGPEERVPARLSASDARRPLMNRHRTGAQPTAASANFPSTQRARAAAGTLSSGPQRAGEPDATPPADAGPTSRAPPLRPTARPAPGSRTRRTRSRRRLR